MAEVKNQYFQSETIRFFSTGTALLDCVLGGGWAIGRLINIVGNSATGKSLLGYEACGSFAKAFPDSPMWYNDIELTTDESYLSQLGISLDPDVFINTMSDDGEPSFRSIEMVGDDLLERAEKLPSGGQALYVLDSYDSLSDTNELDRKMTDKNTYGADKAKAFNVFLRKANALFPAKGVTCIIISQIREDIGAMGYGKQYRRQGQQPLNFYSSQILWLTSKQKLKRTVNKIEQIYGVTAQAQCRKNKVGIPWREADLDIYFGYGTDDLGSNLKFLSVIGALDEVPGLDATKKRDITEFIHKAHYEMDPTERKKLSATLATLVHEKWSKMESGFVVPHTKFDEM